MEGSGILSRLTFHWIQPIIRRGGQQTITDENLNELSPEDRCAVVAGRLQTLWEAEVRGCPDNPRLWRVLLLLNRFHLIQTAIIGMVESISKISQAGYLYAMGLSFAVLLQAFMHHIFYFGLARTILNTRVGLSALIFSKSLRLPAASSLATGTVVNLISNDLMPFEVLSSFIHSFWLGPFEIALAFYFLWSSLRFSLFVGLGIFALMIPMQLWFAHNFSRIREFVVKARDQRVRLLSDTFSGMSLVKLSAWERILGERILSLRRLELGFLKRAARFKSVNEGIFFSSGSLVCAATFITLHFINTSFHSSQVFTTMTLFNHIRLTMACFVPKFLESLAEAKVSSRRIVDFLMLSELHALESPSKPTPSPLPNSDCDSDENNSVLKDLTLTLGSDELCAVIGPVGSGKSSFCMSLMGELAKTAPLTSSRQPRISYSAQVPWIMAGSVRENIIFYSGYEPIRYQRVIECCALGRDLALMEEGDATLVGEKGTNLSGGQRARISLARAVYHDADLYVLDDPLSAVDSQVGRHLFERAIRGLLRDKPVVLVTHQLQFISQCDSVLILDEGRVFTHGAVDTVTALLLNHLDQYGVLETPPASSVSVTPPIGTLAPNPAALPLPVDSKTMWATPGEHTLVVPKIPNPEKAMPSVDTPSSLTKKASPAEKNSTADPQSPDVARLGDREQSEEGVTPLSTYYQFMRFGAPVLALIALVVLMLLGQVSLLFTDYYLSRWSMMPPEEQSKHSHVTLYAGLAILTLTIAISRSMSFLLLTLRASDRAFRHMLDAVLSSPMHFFNVNPQGRILNRFTKDQSSVDEQLPLNFYDATQACLMVVGAIVVICLANPWIIISVPVILFGFGLLRRSYMAANRVIKRIESASRSPVYSILSETLDGLGTIRTFRAGPSFMGRFAEALDQNARAFFIFMGCSRWLGFRLDFMSALFVTLSSMVTVASRANSDPGMVGLGLCYIIQLLGLLQWMVRQTTEVEILFVAVERMMAYVRLPSEPTPANPLDPPPQWPQEGCIEFRGMNLTYPGTSRAVLQNVNLQTRQGEKIGVVGRTGAGKSSLLTALFRLTEAHPAGSIIIDGVDISRLPLSELRQCLTIIPQEAFLFHGTLRFNLDPFDQYTDAQLWDALEACELKTSIEKLPERLESPVSENGKNFSVGERQLFSLSRAVLKNARVIIMDEATANVDLHTDKLIQKTIQTQFAHATVLTIAHRLHTVIGESDRILVLDRGEVKEFDEPWVLLQKSGGWLSNLVARTGPETELELRAAASAKWQRDLPRP
ncbi:P-loop containing nucleoside triphosphate hydrolase protein [Dimargaris cristalligena]|uniref:P-loop containing nucleoside triphosphate hydrolase protein n=1 Tax=Dimargaris cristalligena TaxID=215637 RepID=A0A4Q0A1E3_9FUNG|nr:P-loop containing nucleoside triphosphate hydrolase protein [Dimargaris cristalligena]|eukprot:RKP39936.1 P-loop containing nucleoside triphosphate hydrolase protein [Dimargaris cristalligena]